MKNLNMRLGLGAALALAGGAMAAETQEPQPKADKEADEALALDGDALERIGPKCYAAIKAAQQNACPLIVLAPVLRAAALAALSEIALICDGCEPLTVPHACVTPRMDAVVLTLLRLCEEEITALGEP